VASVYRLQERIAGMMLGGASIDRVEAEVIEPCGLDEDHKAELRLFAGSLDGDHRSRASVAALAHERRGKGLGSWPVGGARRVDRGLPRHASAALLARETVDELMGGLSPELRENTKLVVSELVTNAVRHGRGRVALSLALVDGARPIGEVADEGEPFEAPRTGPGEGDIGGWGLCIVAALAERWGVSGGARVWFAMPANAAGNSRSMPPTVGRQPGAGDLGSPCPAD
jgi:anti-sigma regulatory factor (Ser/Thr protein kinase)